jgi:hypothetical protein
MYLCYQQSFVSQQAKLYQLSTKYKLTQISTVNFFSVTKIQFIVSRQVTKYFYYYTLYMYVYIFQIISPQMSIYLQSLYLFAADIYNFVSLFCAEHS